eukprot:5185893-Prymnesium_polylepis.1
MSALDGQLAAAQAAAEAAWVESQVAPGAVALDPALEAKQHHAGNEVRGAMHQMMREPSSTSNLTAALDSLQLPPEVRAAAERRAQTMCGHIRPQNAPHLWGARPAEAAAGAPMVDSFGGAPALTPQRVAELDAAHDQLWQSLGDGRAEAALNETRQATVRTRAPSLSARPRSLRTSARPAGGIHQKVARAGWRRCAGAGGGRSPPRAPP